MIERQTVDSLFVGEMVASGQGYSLGLLVALCLVSLVLGFLLGRIFVSRQGLSDEAQRQKEEVLKEKVDYDNVIGSAFDARPFAKKLKVKCHPDRFAGDEVKMKLAEVLHQEVEENSRNMKELEKLEKRIESELYS